MSFFRRAHRLWLNRAEAGSARSRNQGAAQRARDLDSCPGRANLDSGRKHARTNEHTAETTVSQCNGEYGDSGSHGDAGADGYRNR